MPSLLIDLDGVVYQDNAAIQGAVNAIAWIQTNGFPHLFVTNTSSKPRHLLVQKLHNYGIDTDEDHILTPAVAASEWLANNAPGPVILFVPDATREDFRGVVEVDDATKHNAAAVVIGDLGNEWTFSKLNHAFRCLMVEPAPILIALGMTRYWRAPDGLRLDVAPFIKALEHAVGCKAKVLGKPSPDFFKSALHILKCRGSGAVMIGDDIVGDIHAAQQVGLKGVLVRTGKFRPQDLTGKYLPDAIINSIAELPVQEIMTSPSDEK